MGWGPLPRWPGGWPWPREHGLRALGVGAGAALGLLLLPLVVYSWVALARFERVEERRATFVYAAAQPLVTGINVRRVDLAGTLARLKDPDSPGVPPVPGQFPRLPGGWEIHHRSGAGVPGLVEGPHDRITRGGRGGG